MAAATSQHAQTEAPVRDPILASDFEKADTSSFGLSTNGDPEKADVEPGDNPEENDLETPANEPPAPAAWSPPPVPDGGFQAWLQVAGSFMLFFNTW